MKQVATLVVVAMVLTTAPKAFTQAVSSQSGTLVPGITQSFGFVPAGTVISPKQHAPFSAVIIEQMEETLADGTHITRSNEEAVKRDGMGRIYRARTIKVVERERTAASKGAPGATPRQIITITDPVERLQYVCTPIKVCRKMGYRTWPNGRGPQRGPYPPLPPGKDRNVTEEDLGTSAMGGLEVVGKRVTRVFPEGTVGNDRAFTSVEELWHSDELDVNIQVKRTDPRWGTRTTTLSEVNLGEPDASYFQIPEGYRIEDRQMPPPQPQVEPAPQNQ